MKTGTLYLRSELDLLLSEHVVQHPGRVGPDDTDVERRLAEPADWRLSAVPDALLDRPHRRHHAHVLCVTVANTVVFVVLVVVVVAVVDASWPTRNQSARVIVAEGIAVRGTRSRHRVGAGEDVVR